MGTILIILLLIVIFIIIAKNNYDRSSFRKLKPQDEIEIISKVLIEDDPEYNLWKKWIIIYQLNGKRYLDNVYLTASSAKKKYEGKCLIKIKKIFGENFIKLKNTETT